MIDVTKLWDLIRKDNPSYEREYAGKTVFARPSRLHNLVSCIRRSQSDYLAIAQEVAKVPPGAWTKYKRTLEWLIWKLAQENTMIPAQPLITQVCIEYHDRPMDASGFHRENLPPRTGVINEPDGFQWSVSVTYTLRREANPDHYLPVRTEKSVDDHQDKGGPAHNCLSMDAIKANTHAIQAANADGPSFINVKRDATSHSIIIWDEPGLDRRTRGAYAPYGGHHPIRFCALFEISLFPIADNVALNDARIGKDSVRHCTRGNAVLGSSKRFGMAMEKFANGTINAWWNPDGDRANRWEQYANPIERQAPPNPGKPAPVQKVAAVVNKNPFIDDFAKKPKKIVSPY